VCYQLFVRKLIPDMGKSSTNRVSTQLVYAREEGLIPWEWIVDETREAERVAAWTDLTEFGEVVRKSYRRSRWKDQPRQVEVWSEKGTVRGTLRPVLDEYGVTFRVMHGYGSATAVNQVAEESRGLERPLLALYCGDHDCSGSHMSEADLPDRLGEYAGHVEVERVALVQSHLAGLPSFPAKRSDPRYDWYVERYGNRCWEVDALNPNTLRAAVEQRIRDVIEWDRWERCELIEKTEFESLDVFVRGLQELPRPDAGQAQGRA
jgi:hypothetical protein